MTENADNQIAKVSLWHYTLEGKHKEEGNVLEEGNFLFILLTTEPTPTDFNENVIIDCSQEGSTSKLFLNPTL